MIPSPLLSLAAGTEGPCRAASTRLYSHLPECFWEGEGGCLYTEEDKSLVWKLVAAQSIRGKKAMISQLICNPQ